MNEEDLNTVNKGKEFFYCIDHKDIKLANEFTSYQQSYLSFSISNPYCGNTNESNFEC